MLGKLLLFEVRGLWKPALLLFGVMVAAGVAGTVCFHGVQGVSGYYTAASSFLSGATVGLFMGSLFCGFLVWASVVALFVLVAVRFYRTLFTDEGYLALTLPVSAVQLVGAKFIVSFAVIALAAFLSMALASLMMAAVSAGELGITWVISAAGGLFGMVDTGSAASMLAGGANILVTSAYNVALIFASLTLGAWWARRHKVACALALYVGISWAFSLVFSTASMVLLFNNVPELLLGAMAVVQVVLYLGAAAGLWALSVWAVGRKVDLS